MNFALLAVTITLACGVATGEARPAPQPPAVKGSTAATGPSVAVGAGRILVVPFENLQREARLYWLAEASALLVTEDLQAAGLNAIGREARLRAFERLQLPAVASLSEATVIRIGQLVGAAQVVLGSYALDGNTLVVRARTIQLDTGRMSNEVVERGPLDSLFQVYEAVGRRLGAPAVAAASARAESRPAGGARPPLLAFESYVKGLLAESPAGQIRFLEAALKAWGGYDAARIALWHVHSGQGDHARAVATALAVPAESPLSRRARFLAALSRIRSRQYDDAFQGLKALLEEQRSPAVFNNLGIVQLRRGSTPQTGRATYYFNHAAEADPDDPDFAFNLGYAYWFERDPQAAVYWLKEAVRRNPADGDAHYVVGVALQATGAAVEAEREKELARQLSSKYREWERRPTPGEAVPRGLERPSEDLDAGHLSLVDATLAPGERRDQRDLAAFHLERARRLFGLKQDREAIDELQRCIYVSPYQAEAHLLLGRIHLRNGRLREASEALKISVWSQETVAAHVALAEVYLQMKDHLLAQTEADKALTLDPASPEARAVRARVKR